MKRFSGKPLALAVTAALLLCLTASSALAVTPQDVISITVDHCEAGGEYMLLLVTPGTKASSIGGSNLLFADQYTASGTSIRAAVVYPGFTACDAYAGGTFSNGAASPRKLGSFQAARMPEQATEIEDSAFESVAFTHVFLGGSVTSIGSRAFAACSGLVYIYIPESVTHIEADAFAGSAKVTIGCKSGSDAHDFALSNSIPFVLVN